MSSSPLASILEEYAAQRRYREQKRNLFLKRFENIKASFHHGSHQHSAPPVQPERPLER